MQDLGSFVGRSKEWDELRALIAKAQGGLRHLSSEEMIRYVRLYRRASADLASLTSSGVNPVIASDLNTLVARAYGQLYRAPRRGFMDGLARFLWTAADTVRRRSVFVYVAIGLFLVSLFAAYGLLEWVPATRSHLVVPGMESAFDHWTSGRHPERTGNESVMGSFGYASHNPMVAIGSNAASVATLGIFGMYSMWMNGALIGALIHEVARAGHLGFLLHSIFPHGVPELGGFFIATGAGIMLGYTTINPGRRTRSQALKIAGRDSLMMLLISLLMILFAAPIEGFFSFNPIFPPFLKVGLGVINVILFLSFFILYGKNGPPAGATEEELRPQGISDPV